MRWIEKKGKEFREKDLLDFYDVEVANNTPVEKRLWSKIINSVKKSKQCQYIFHYLTKHTGRGVKENIKRLHQVDSNNKIKNTFLDQEPIKKAIMEYNKLHF